MKKILRNIVALSIVIIVSCSSVMLVMGKTTSQTTMNNNPEKSEPLQPRSPIYPPSTPVQVNPDHNYPNDMNKGIGKIRINQPGGVLQTFTTTSENPEEVYYKFFFGDSTSSGWIGPYNYGGVATVTHDYNSIGTFQVTAIAKVYDIESSSSPALSVRMYVLGDTNGNDVVGFDDINPFVLMLSNGKNIYYNSYPNGYWFTGDTNLDFVVDFADINPFVAILSGN